MAGRKPKSAQVKETPTRSIRIAPELLAKVEAVRDKDAKETFTAQVEDGLRRHIRARKRRQPED